jgi:hypothetical protein
MLDIVAEEEGRKEREREGEKEGDENGEKERKELYSRYDQSAEKDRGVVAVGERKRWGPWDDSTSERAKEARRAVSGEFSPALIATYLWAKRV